MSYACSVAQNLRSAVSLTDSDSAEWLKSRITFQGVCLITMTKRVAVPHLGGGKTIVQPLMSHCGPAYLCTNPNQHEPYL